MSSIYVSICSLSDSELIKSIKSCLSQSSGENEIFLGIAHSSRVLSKEDILNIGKEIQQIVPKSNFKYYSSTNHMGTGVGRRKAYEMYSGEDYMLQVDCHSLYKKDWDLTLIDQLIRGQSIFGKSVITGYPDSYFYTENGISLRYSWFPAVSYFIDTNISSTQYRDDPSIYNILPNFNDRVVDDSPGNFELNQKISGGLLFGDQQFAENYDSLIQYDYTLPEEELFMSIELIHHGFKLLTPLEPMPVAHLYYEDINSIGGKREILSTEFLYRSEAKEEIINYYISNKHKIKKFQEYAKVNMQDLFIDGVRGLSNENELINSFLN
jgi:hypothetical protein